MRIVSGSLKGRNIDCPSSHKTHPMSEKMRGALFNVLGDVEGFRVYDAYGGSGAIAFEAISRGAKSVLITEINKHAWAIIKQNIQKLHIEDKVRLVRANSASWSANNYETKFDLVICDPPYEKINITQLNQLTKNVKKEGLFILSSPSNYLTAKFDGFNLIKDSDYGDGSLAFYRKI